MRTVAVVYFVTFIVCCGSLTRYISHIQNYVNLVSAYNLDGYSTIDFPPLADVSQAMVINIDMHLYAVNGFDEVAGNIELVVAMEMSWVDEMSIIQSISFKIEDRAEFLVPYDMIWTPKLVLTNAIGASSDVGDSAYLCRFDMATKRILWKPRVVVSGSCTPDVTYYPFDKQECDFVYTAWGFKSDEILLETNSDGWNMVEYDESGEWDIDSTNTEAYIQNGQSYIKFKIVMVRKPLYFAFNILLPILVLCLLNSTVFLLPAESGERVGFSVTCFLSFMVLLNMIMDIMPRSSNPISFLCYYLVVMMSNSGAMTLVTILLMRVYHKPEKSEVPKWMQRAVTFVNCGCAKLRCCVLCCRFLRKKCCCEDQRKCGCKEKKKKISEESLVEITVDKDQNIVEKPAAAKKLRKSSRDKDGDKTRKCCILSCVKRTNSKCCCGVVVGCRKCSKANNHTDSSDAASDTDHKRSSCLNCLTGRKHQLTNENNDKSDASHRDSKSSLCFNFLRESERKLEDDKKIMKHEEESIRTDERETENNSKCFGFFQKSDISDSNETSEMRDNIKEQNKVREENGKQIRDEQQQDSSKGCFTYCGIAAEKNPAQKKTVSGNEERKDVEGSLQTKDSESKGCHKANCFTFTRKRKVSTVDDIETDIVNDILPVSVRSEDSKTIKISFKGKENLDNEETLLQRWEDATKSTTIKKGNSLNPITINDQDNSDETKIEILQGNSESDFTVRTKSIRATNMQNEQKAREKNKIKTENEDTDFELEIVRKTKSLRNSIKEKKENMPKPIVHEKVNIPQKRRMSTVKKIGVAIDGESEDSDESDVDSLADLEEEVTWPEVGRILDTFFFFAFAGGQAFLTVVFLVPLFTGDTKGSDA